MKTKKIQKGNKLFVVDIDARGIRNEKRYLDVISAGKLISVSDKGTILKFSSDTLKCTGNGYAAYISEEDYMKKQEMELIITNVKKQIFDLSIVISDDQWVAIRDILNR